MSKVATLPAKPFELAAGGHSNITEGACFNELASVLAGEPFSYSPACVSPVIRRIGMRLNDRLDNERRQLLRPFVLRSLGTANDGRDEERRQMCNEWLLHYALPDMLDKAGKAEIATRLRALPGDLAVEGVRRAIREARDEAWDARKTAVEKLKARILEELKKRPVAVAAAAAVDVAVAAADVVAVADVVAAADVAAAAVAVAAVADVADVADVAAAAVADVAAAAVADVAVAVGYWKVRNAVYWAIREKVEKEYKPTSDELLNSAIDLLDRMLPPAPLQPPVIEHADVICAVAA